MPSFFHCFARRFSVYGQRRRVEICHAGFPWFVLLFAAKRMEAQNPPGGKDPKGKKVILQSLGVVQPLVPGKVYLLINWHGNVHIIFKYNNYIWPHTMMRNTPWKFFTAIVYLWKLAKFQMKAGSNLPTIMAFNGIFLLHLRKWTCCITLHLKMGAPWKRRFILETIIFRVQPLDCSLSVCNF